MGYADRLAAISHTSITLVVMTLDFCDRTFGTSPCLATGTKCYNTRVTCVYTTAFLDSSGKQYKFTSADAPAPFNDGEHPYLLGVSYLPTEIREDRTVAGRVSLEFLDEPDGDIGIDPYLSSRSSVQGTFWKKLLARNPNYKGRAVEIYEGFLGLAEADFVKKFKGKIETITFGRGRVRVELSDPIVDLSEAYIPAKLDIRLRVAATDSQTSLDIDDVSKLAAAPAYVRINDEIIKYTGIYTAGNQLTGCSRAQFGTTATAHDAGDKVGQVKYYSPNRPTNTAGIILATDLGLTSSDFDATTLSTIWNAPDLNVPYVEGIIAEPTKASDLIFELLELGDTHMWVGEDLKLVFARRTPNAGGRSYGTIADAQNVVLGSGGVDLNDDERLTRILVYWDMDPIGEEDEAEYYARLDVVIAADAESSAWYAEEKERVIYSRWLRSTAESDIDAYQKKVRNMLLRILARNKHARPLVALEVARKDSGNHTGDFVRLSTDEMLDRTGIAIDSIPYQVMKREDLGFKIRLNLRQAGHGRMALVAPTSSPVYTSATPADKEYGFISNSVPNEGRMNNGDEGYLIA